MPSISACSLSKSKMRREFHRSSHFHSTAVAAAAVLDPYLREICEIQNDMRNCIRRNLNFRVLHYFQSIILWHSCFVLYLISLFFSSFLLLLCLLHPQENVSNSLSLAFALLLYIFFTSHFLFSRGGNFYVAANCHHTHKKTPRKLISGIDFLRLNAESSSLFLLLQMTGTSVNRNRWKSTFDHFAFNSLSDVLTLVPLYFFSCLLFFHIDDDEKKNKKTFQHPIGNFLSMSSCVHTSKH